jgi:hypothetical protein
MENRVHFSYASTVMLALLVVAWICVRRTAMALAMREEQELRFEEEEPPLVMGLGLYPDGVMAIEVPHRLRHTSPRERGKCE